MTQAYIFIPLTYSMKTNKPSDRREFIKKAAVVTGGIGMAGHAVMGMSQGTVKGQNPLPKWKGFNVLDFFSPDPNKHSQTTTEEDLKWMSDWGFDFMRIPRAMKDIDKLPPLKYPGQVGDQYLSRAMLEKFYKPWIKLAQSGTGVHCGECGCFTETPHDIFLAWFGDVVDILTSNGIRFALWNFMGGFGILDSGRKDVDYEAWHGHQLDRKLLDLIRKS